MSIRKIPLVTNEIYHVFNRSIALQPIFKSFKYYQRMLDIIDFYRFVKPLKRFSHYNRLSLQDKKNFLEALYNNDEKQIEVLAFAIMSNHYHLLLRQIKDNGITEAVKLIQESYAKYVNTKDKRFGSIFQSRFKAVRIETDEQLLHVARYIHLNPLTSFVISETEKINQYPWTSFTDYINDYSRPFVNTNLIYNFFKSKEKFINFTLDQLDYQRQLETIKHLIYE